LYTIISFWKAIPVYYRLVQPFPPVSAGKNYPYYSSAH